MLWKAERRWKAKGWSIAFGGEEEDEYRSSSMMWQAIDGYDAEDKRTWMVDGIIVVEPGHRAQAGSPWWTSTYKDGDERTLKVGCKGKQEGLPVFEAFDLLGYRFRRTGKWLQVTEKTLMKNGMGSWWRDGYIHRARKCVFQEEVRQGGQSRFQHGSECENELSLQRGKSAEFRRQRKAEPNWVVFRKRTSGEMRVKWRTMEFTSTAEKNVERVSKTMAWATYDGDVLVVKALRSLLRWRTTTWWRNRSLWKMRVDPMNVSRWKHKCGFHNRGVVWNTLCQNELLES